MKISEIVSESVVNVWGRSAGKLTRRYRCTSGIRKGRIVSNPATCAKPRDLKRSVAFKKTMGKRGKAARVKASRTKRATFSTRLRRLNVGSGRQKLGGFKPSKRKPIK